MIVFLTLCYCGLMFLLIKLNVIRLTLWWKLSPVVWMTLLTFFLFIPMQWGAPSGPVNVYQMVVEVIPNVTGEVIEVPVEGLTPINKDDVLFRIDPVPFQAQVDRLQAQLADTIQNVEQLKASAEAAHATVSKTEADVDLLKAQQLSAAAAVSAAKAGLREAMGKQDKAKAMVQDAKIQLDAGQREFDRIDELVRKEAASRSDLDVAEIQLTRLKNQLNVAEADQRVAADTVARFEADERAAEASSQVVDLQLRQLIDTELPRVRAVAKEADLAANSMIGDEHTSVAAVRAQLADAEYDLKETVVRAPGNGYAVGVTLRPGQRVSNLPLRSWMSYVLKEQTTIGVGLPQYALRHVQPGQKAEVTLKLYPGRIFSATVDELSYVSSQGQLSPSGTVMAAPGVDQSAVPFGVRLKLDENADIDVTSLPGGSVGTAAIYTDQVKATHIIRKVMIRMDMWMNYIIPW